jgi:hypothetical protein
MVKAEKGVLLHGLEYALGRGRASIQPIFSHLWCTVMSLALNNKELGPGDKRCAQLNSPSHRYVLVEHYLSLRVLEKVSSEVIAIITCGEQSGSHEMITPVLGCSLIIIGNCSHLGGGGSVLQGSTVL